MPTVGHVPNWHDVQLSLEDCIFIFCEVALIFVLFSLLQKATNVSDYPCRLAIYMLAMSHG
jgi:hypothetical protein